MRDIKSVVAYIFHKKFGLQGSNMKYTQFDEEEQNQSINNIMLDSLQVEGLNCDLKVLSSEFSGPCESNSLTGVDLEVCDEGATSSNTKTDFSDHNSSEKPDPTEMEEDETELKLVITYHFSFDTAESVVKEDKHMTECETVTTISDHAEQLGDEEFDDYESDEDDMFEDGSFRSDDEEELLEYSCVKNGSKNNLLDESYDQDIEYSIRNVRLVDYDSETTSEHCASNSDPETDLNDANGKTNISDGDDNNETWIKNCGYSSMPSMRKNFIYYSSAVRLYSGKLRYEDSYPQKKFKFARKIIKKVFPTQKYVINN